jgi:hypothetical protein
VTYELISEYPAAGEREYIGRLLRHAFPLGLGAFAELLSAIRDQEIGSTDSI